MNQQEIFDKVFTHIMKQGKPALNSKGECVYRGKNGLTCAAGCLIDDEQYSPQMEGTTFVGASTIMQGITPEWMKEEQMFICQLQNAHDTAADCDDFLGRFRTYTKILAEEYELTVPEVPA